MWQPFREPVFRALWIAAFFSNVGSLMQDVAAAWLMTSLTSQPLMVALLQTAVNLPFFVLALLAGALADVIDRRMLLVIGMSWMTVAALGLGCITLAGMASPVWLLVFTLFMGFGAAITSPAWNALIPELVPKEKLEQAIALNSVGYNTARGLGSATGGILVATSGPGFVFMLNAFSFFGIIGVLLWWKRPTQTETQGTREPLLSAMRAGMRFARHSPGLRAVFAKTSLWATCTAAMWSLIPLIARQKLGLDSTQYGLLLSAFGGGTLIGRDTFTAVALASLSRAYFTSWHRPLGFGEYLNVIFSQLLADDDLHGSIRSRLGNCKFVPQHRCPAGSSFVGTSSGACSLRSYLSGMHRARQRPLGKGG